MARTRQRLANTRHRNRGAMRPNISKFRFRRGRKTKHLGDPLQARTLIRLAPTRPPSVLLTVLCVCVGFTFFRKVVRIRQPVFTQHFVPMFNVGKGNGITKGAGIGRSRVVSLAKLSIERTTRTEDGRTDGRTEGNVYST